MTTEETNKFEIRSFQLRLQFALWIRQPEVRLNRYGRVVNQPYVQIHFLASDATALVYLKNQNLMGQVVRLTKLEPTLVLVIQI